MTSNELPTATTAAFRGGAEGRRPAAPTLTVPARSSIDGMFLMASPGPLTLASTLFPEETPDSEFRSFTQLLVGAMNSPVGAGVAGRVDGGKEEEGKKKEEKGGGGRVESLAVPARESDVFTIPPGLSPTGLFSPVMGNFGISHQQALAQVTAQAAQSNVSMFSSENQAPSSNNPPVNEVHGTDTNIQNHEAAPQQPPMPTDKPADDGYNWRKYGQKVVKGSDFPRSYYKCTSSGCPVKKKIERSADGQISEIIYKGQHNHALPTNKRGKDVTAGNEGGNAINGSNSNQKPNINSSTSTQLNDGLKRERELTEQMSGSSDSEEEEEQDDSKRRSIEATAASQRALAEPRIIVQTTSEVDLLDDGYRWRKYGQKVVKGNPHPRSYYKCTYSGCSVKKHIERSAQDQRSVITTYEGKHNHDLPVGRNSSHVPANSNTQNRGQVAVLQMKQEHEIT